MIACGSLAEIATRSFACARGSWCKRAMVFEGATESHAARIRAFEPNELRDLAKGDKMPSQAPRKRARTSGAIALRCVTNEGAFR